MTRLIHILVEGVAEAALAACALAQRVLELTGAKSSKTGRDYPAKGAMVRHDVPPVE